MSSGTLDAAEVVHLAHERLDWIRGDYGDDDVDYLTFAPLVELAEELLEELSRRLTDDPRSSKF